MDERQNILQRVKLLTPREYETLTYVITGMLNKQTAYILEIIEKTVKANSLAELVRMAG